MVVLNVKVLIVLLLLARVTRQLLQVDVPPALQLPGWGWQSCDVNRPPDWPQGSRPQPKGRALHCLASLQVPTHLERVTVPAAGRWGCGATPILPDCERLSQRLWSPGQSSHSPVSGLSGGSFALFGFCLGGGYSVNSSPLKCLFLLFGT